MQLPVNRRNFLTGSVAAAATPSFTAAQGKPRRVVFIMTDTTRWDMLNCARQTGLQTPNLDRLAAGGVRFDRAYTCQPVCTPARSALFTGTFPHTNGAWGNSMPLGQTAHTIGQRLSSQGIHTAYMGKWHLDGADYFDTGRCPDGWDKRYWFAGRNYLEELSPQDRTRSRQTETNREPDLKAEFTFGHKVASRAVSFLESHNKEDFFLAVSFDEPHGPFVCPRPYADMYKDFVFPDNPNRRDTLANKPEHQRVWAGNRLNRDPGPIVSRDFFGCQSFVDFEIGRVLDAIDRHAPDALVIYTSDHGDFLGSHRLTGKGPAMYDEITRIPFLVRWPGRAPAKTACSHPVSHIDVVPTILDAFGLPVPKTVEGKSMLPTIRDPKIRPNEAVFTEFNRFEIDHDGFGAIQPVRSAFDGRYKLAINVLCTDELYDLEADPGEMNNLIDSPGHAKTRNELHDRVIDWMNRTRDPFRGYYWERRAWRPNVVPKWTGTEGMTRQREADGYEPRQLDYDTGLEMKQATRKK
jgi:uncharacterized sulfatase